MNFKYDVSETDILALSERYYSSSTSHRKTRESARLLLPLILIPVTLLFIYKFGFSPIPVAIFSVTAIGWYVLYPWRFDMRVRRYAKKQMQESGFANLFGTYEVGESKYKWNAVNRAELSEKYLFVFLSGPQGLVIPVSQVGFDIARQACDTINQNVKSA